MLYNVLVDPGDLMTDKFDKRRLVRDRQDELLFRPIDARRETKVLDPSESMEPLNTQDVTTAPSAEIVDPVHRLVLGRDSPPGAILSNDDLKQLNDPFATKVLRHGLRPMSVDELLSVLDDDTSPDAVSREQSFLVGEGGQIPWSEDTKNLARALRFVVVRQNNAGDEIMLSIDDQPGDPTGLLQLLSWDPVKKAYNFYQRSQTIWFFMGDSNDALRPDSAGNGPFDGHVNGSLVMKELRFPWLHWSSETEKIEANVFEPGHPILSHKVFLERTGAEILERRIVVPGIDKWTDARLERAISADLITDARNLLRQIVVATSTNIISAPNPLREVTRSGTLKVPWEVFLNRELWTRRGMLQSGVLGSPIEISGGAYLDAIAALNVRLEDASSGFSQSGDSFFPLACPGPAYEDLSVVKGLISEDVVSKKFVQALSAVDFFNPLQSRRRERFEVYFPDQADLRPGSNSVEARTLNAMVVAAGDPDSDEAYVTRLMNLGDDAAREELSDTVAQYVEKVRLRLASEDGVRDLVKLIDSRRRYFRTLGISEFSMTLPVSDLPKDSDFLEMTEDGLVQPQPPAAFV